jgi:hypothetical protein
MQDRESFIFYKSFYEAIKNIKDKDKIQIYEAICRYSLYEEEIELTGIRKTLFTLIKPQLKANNKRFEDGKKGGRPKKITTGYENKITTGYENKKTTGYSEKKPNNNVNDNVNDNVNVNDNDNVKRKKFVKPTLEEIKNYCTERNNKINPNKFYDFYESKGWKIGKEPMKDWQACIRTWEQKDTSNLNCKKYEQRKDINYNDFYDN